MNSQMSAPALKGGKLSKMLKQALKSDKLGLLIALAIIVIVFQYLTGNKYFTPANITNIMIAMSVVGLVTIGESFLLITGKVDLSPGSVAAFSGVLVALLLNTGMNMYLAIAIVVAAGMGIGMINALLINKLKLEAFIATLATMSIFRGFAYIICGGKAIFITNGDYLKFGAGRFLDIPIPVLFFLVLFFVFLVVLARTRFGRSVYMVGGNPTASRLTGINSQRVLVALYMLTAAFSALGGCIMTARMSSGQPMSCEGLEFDAVTAAVPGGVDTQKTLPFGTRDEVRRQVLGRIQILNQGGGYVFNPIHNVVANVPPENLIAMYQAAQAGR